MPKELVQGTKRTKARNGCRRRAKARSREAEARQREVEARQREAEARQKEAEARQREAEARQREAEARQREAEARMKEAEARARQVEAWLREPFRLTDLPMELQLMVLSHCVISEDYYTDMFIRPNIDGRFQRLSWPTNVTLAILRTCPVYSVEGNKLFWRNNRFILRAGYRMTPPAIGSFLSGRIEDYPWMRRLTLYFTRLKRQCHFLQVGLRVVDFALRMPSIQFLLILVDDKETSTLPARGMYAPCDSDFFRDLGQARRVFSKYRVDSSPRSIRELVINGPNMTHDSVLVAVRLMSTLMARGGWMSIGYFNPIHCVKAYRVEKWIRKRRRSSKWVDTGVPIVWSDFECDKPRRSSENSSFLSAL